VIRLTRLNGVPLYLNSDLIEHIDATPDTVITLTSGPKFLVAETPAEVCEKILDFRKSILAPPSLASATPGHRDITHG